MIWKVVVNQSGNEIYLLDSELNVPEGHVVIAETANPDYLAPPQVPESVTMRQGRLALLAYGLLDTVNEAIQAIEDPAVRKAAMIEWEYAQTIDRNSQFVSTMIEQLGLSTTQRDQLFILASTL